MFRLKSSSLRKIGRLCLGLLVLAAAVKVDTAWAAIDTDEHVVLFETFGYLSDDNKFWIIPIHGWVYELKEESRVRKKILNTVWRLWGMDQEAMQSTLFQKRARLFLVDNERWKKISVQACDKVYPMKRSKTNGHFRKTLRISANEISTCQEQQGTRQANRIRFQVVLPPDDDRLFSCSVQKIEPTGISIISDIDDTVKVSEVTSRTKLLANTFLKEFSAVPGMACAYQALAAQNVQFHYVSAGPWQLYPSILEFLTGSGFPAGSIHLQQFRWKDASIVNLSRSPYATKRKPIESILRAFPRRKFIFIGDSGQKDPELYGALARKYPDQVLQIFIRDVTGEPTVSKRYRKDFRDVPEDRWKIIHSASEIESFIAKFKSN